MATAVEEALVLGPIAGLGGVLFVGRVETHYSYRKGKGFTKLVITAALLITWQESAIAGSAVLVGDKATLQGSAQVVEDSVVAAVAEENDNALICQELEKE